MEKSIQLKLVSLSDLILDKENPRFGKLYKGGSDENKLIEYLLYNEAASDIAKSISITQRFYEDKALWVLKKGDKYLVKDGNRRCASLKALVNPDNYNLTFEPFNLEEGVPVYVYKDKEELNKRISEEHAGSLFRRWERIAKAIEVYRLHLLEDEEGVKHLESNPGDLIRLAIFYEEAFKVAGEKLNVLLRRGRKNSGGKTIIFERMFKYKKKCGYDFKNAPKYGFKLINKDRFEDYIKCMVDLLTERGDEIITDTIDKQFNDFKKLLKEYGFDIDEKFEEDSIKEYDSSRGTNSGGTNS
ncbi:hypothetical protein HX089_15960, partial [Myroides odoratimimus]|uniref:hypothetical protein n=1 Tax=Myroides odoratimimus TaxID=76832 RepID=UPI00257911BD